MSVGRMIDLRSDTVTVPTEAMRRAMAAAEVGDDVYGEDPTVNRLEEMAAAAVGKEAALFCVSGTMANHVAVMTHTGRGDEVLVEEQAHIYFYEVGAMAVLSGVQPRTLPSRRGTILPETLRAALRPANIHFPPTRLLCLENTHNRHGGSVVRTEDLRAVAAVAREAGIRVHLDGARIFNAATALGVTAAEIAAPTDSVMFCLSKGLAAPLGSMLCGSREFISRARKNRKLVGGGLRQVGVVAAAGIVALTGMVDRLGEDHDNARVLAAGLARIDGLEVDPDLVETNIVACGVVRPGLTAPALAEALDRAGVRCNATGQQRIRLVTNKDISRSDVEEAGRIIARTMSRV